MCLAMDFKLYAYFHAVSVQATTTIEVAADRPPMKTSADSQPRRWTKAASCST